jgi:hypothetical protein
MSGEKLPDNPGDRLARLEDLYRDWDEVRSRSELDTAPAGPVRRAVGLAGRTAALVRDLGISGDRQRELFRALIDHQIEMDGRLRTLEGRMADILGALHEMWKLHERSDAGAREGGAEANLRDRQEILRVRQIRLEAALADLRDEIAVLRGGASVAVLPLTPRDFALLLAQLEEGVPAGERAGAVEVSLQDIRAESLLWAARRHFGGRLSSSGPSYRGPNDLWIHVDFTADWSRPLLLENAAARLEPSGRFVLVTAPATGEVPRHVGLVLAEDRQVPVTEGGPVRVLVWRKEPFSG